MIAVLSQGRQFASAAQQAYRDRVLALSPVAYCELEDTPNDSSANAYTGSATSVTYAAGKSGRAASFNGSTSIVSVSGALLDITGPFTLAAWINRSVTGPIYRGIVQRDNSTGSPTRSGYYLALDSSNKITVGFNGGGAELTGPTVPANQWCHVAGRWDGATMSVFLDGVKTFASKSGTPRSVSDPMTIGKSNGFWTGGGVPYTGLIDEVCVFARALSDSDIASLATYP